MSLACPACHCLDGPSGSFRSSSVSSSDSEGRCAAIVSCLTQKVAAVAGTAGTSKKTSTSKVVSLPIMASGQGIAGAPCLLRSHAMTRDHVRDWNFDEFSLEV